MPSNPFKHIEFYKGDAEGHKERLDRSIDKVQTILDIANLFSASPANIISNLLDEHLSTGKDNENPKPD